LISLEVESKEPLFDVKVEIPKEFLRVKPGGNLLAQITIFNLVKTGLVNVSIDYTIKDIDGNIVFYTNDVLAIEKYASFIKTLKLPENIKYGDYALYIKVNYDKKTVSASTWFTVGIRPFIILEIILILLLIILIIKVSIVKKRLYSLSLKIAHFVRNFRD